MKRLGFVVAAALMAAMSGFGGVTYYCGDHSKTDGVCGTLNSVLAPQYAMVFENANASIYVRYGNTGSSVAQNNQYYNTVDYTSYYNTLKSRKSGPADDVAGASLSVPIGIPGLPFNLTNPDFLGFGVTVTSAQDQALGLLGAAGTCVIMATCQYNDPRGPYCTAIGTANCYNDVITISNTLSFYYGEGTYVTGQYDFFTTIMHETNEALGTGSCIANWLGTLSESCTWGGLGISASDLYRYSAPGVRALSTLNAVLLQVAGGSPYYSIDGGVTSLGTLHNSTNGPDYGDFATACTHVQDAVGCNTVPGLTMFTANSVELAMLDSVGYKLTPYGKTLSATSADYFATPEPGTIGMFAAAFGGFALVRRRARRQSAGN